MSCPVHPYTTGGEIKTIGLFERPGQSKASRYAEWRRFDKCSCVPSTLTHELRPHGERSMCGKRAPGPMCADGEWPTCGSCLREMLPDMRVGRGGM